MCGIFGWSYPKNSNISRAQRSIIAAVLANGNDTRGGDSWGVCVINKDKTTEIKKGLGDIIEFPGYKIGENDLVLCHTRKATKGSICVKNAHPFEVGDIVGAHNGVIYNDDDLQKKYKREFEVDSTHIFGHIAEGLDFSEIKGYGAIEFIRKSDPSKVYLADINRGDLSVYAIKKEENKDDKKEAKSHGCIWSSNGRHIDEALKLAGIEDHTVYKIEEGTVYYVTEGNLYVTEEKLKIESGFTSSGRHFFGNGAHHNSYGPYASEYTQETTVSKISSKDDENLNKIWAEYLESKEDEEELEKNEALLAQYMDIGGGG
ncbi:MAG: class II glutamine amidotransferase [Elusimicrobia bacterium]|nr:class II glutamine amidotransferase [Elusimicrobiota bacterium]